MLLIVPSDPTSPRRPDPHFAPDANAARAAGFDVAYVDHDALQRADVDAAVRALPAAGDAVYRGWMLTADEYGTFAVAAAARGTRLRTAPDVYRRAHELPGWYPALRGLTAKSRWTVGPDLDDLVGLAGRFGPGPLVLKDYVKSLKHNWDEAMFIPDATDREAVAAVGARFCELRGAAFTGGFVLRRFEDLTGAEVRTWWIDGVCAQVTAHPDSADDTPPADVTVSGFAPAIASLGCRFVTADLVRRTDGAWRLVEIGDGQVSDLPSSASPAALIAALAPS